MSGVAIIHLQIAWRLFKTHWRMLVLAELVLFGSWVGLELAVIALHRFGAFVNLVLHLTFLLLFSGLMVGFLGIARQFVNGNVATLRDLSGKLARGPSFLTAFCLYLVAVLLGLVVFLIPGVYLAVRYALFGQVLAGTRESVHGGLHRAGELSQGHWWQVCSFLLVVAALNLAGAAMLGIGLLISFPVSMLAAASLYRTLDHGTIPISPIPDQPGCNPGTFGNGGKPSSEMQS